MPIARLYTIRVWNSGVTTVTLQTRECWSEARLGMKLQNDPEPPFVCPDYERTEVSERSKKGINIDVIRYIVAEVFHWRGMDRREP